MFIHSHSQAKSVMRRVPLWSRACMHAQSLHCVWLFATPWTAACQGFSVHGIFPSRILEWVAMPSPRGSSWPWDWTYVSGIGKRLLYRWATEQALVIFFVPKKDHKINILICKYTICVTTTVFLQYVQGIGFRNPLGYQNLRIHRSLV